MKFPDSQCIDEGVQMLNLRGRTVVCVGRPAGIAKTRPVRGVHRVMRCQVARQGVEVILVGGKPVQEHQWFAGAPRQIRKHLTICFEAFFDHPLLFCAFAGAKIWLW